MVDCDKETLLVSDDKAFYTLEGEGEYVGMPSVFFRLSMCNLTCKGFASEDSPHGCDSFISWSVKNKMTFNEIFEYFDVTTKITIISSTNIQIDKKVDFEKLYNEKKKN